MITCMSTGLRRVVPLASLRKGDKMNEQLRKTVDTSLPIVTAAVKAEAERNGIDDISNFCLIYAAFTGMALEEVGYRVRPVAGRAAWRVGPLAGDCVHNVPELATTMIGGAFPWHVWIETEDGWVVDMTTQHLKQKLDQLDAADGIKSSFKWDKPYIVERRSMMSNLDLVINSHQCCSYYEEVPGLITNIFTSNGSMITVLEL